MKALVYYRMSSDQQTDSIERQMSEVEPIILKEQDEVTTQPVEESPEPEPEPVIEPTPPVKTVSLFN